MGGWLGHLISKIISLALEMFLHSQLENVKKFLIVTLALYVLCINMVFTD